MDARAFVPRFRQRLFALVITVLIAAVCGAGHSGASPAVPLATFRPATGWLVVDAGRDNPSLIVAVTRHDAGAVQPVALFTSFKQLSRRGILVWAATEGRNRRGFPNRGVWPPVLARFRIERGWEGQPDARIQQRVWVRSVHGWDLDIRVFFGTQYPSAELRREAQEELDRLRLP